MSQSEWFAEPYRGGAEAMDFVRTELIQEVSEQFPEAVEVVESNTDTPEWHVAVDRLHDLAAWLKQRGFNMLLDVGGVDYLPRTPRFEVVYHLLALPELWRVRLRVPVGDDAPEVPTVSDLWPAANPAEREIWDLFGVRFTNHPKLTRIMMPDDWQGHPLRKDYPLQGPRALTPGLPAERNRYHVTKRPVDQPEIRMTWSPEKGADERGSGHKDG